MHSSITPLWSSLLVSSNSPVLLVYSSVRRIRGNASLKKNDNFTIRTHRAQGVLDISPSGRARKPAQCPHAPVTLHYNTCGGCRGALLGHYLCCSRETNVTHALLHRARGVINPVKFEAHPGSGALPLSTEPVLERQSPCKRQVKGNH